MSTGHQLATGVIPLIALIFLAKLSNGFGRDRVRRLYLHEINDFLVVVRVLVLLLEHHIIRDVLSTEFALLHLLLNTDMECVTFGLNWMLKDSVHLIMNDLRFGGPFDLMNEKNSPLNY